MKPIRVTYSNGGREWFADWKLAKKAAKKHGYLTIHTLMLGGDPHDPLAWVECSNH
jgi:hypothetical protein